MALHPAVESLLARLAANGATPPHLGGSLDDSRRALESLAKAAPRAEMAQVQEHTLNGPGGPLPIRIYRPVPAGYREHNCLVWFHGGGWVRGSIDTHDADCRAFAARSDCTVISVGYRLAPEHPFPAAFDDCWFALRWVDQKAGQLGVSPLRIAVGGDSAGGGLAAACCLAARDSGKVRPGLQVLVYPAVDFTLAHPSMDEHGSGLFLEKAAMAWYREQYLGDADPTDWRASPLHAPSLEGVCPALVLTAEYDPLRDEGEAYARRLIEAGVAVTVHRWRGMIHGFALAALGLEQAAKAADEIGRIVRHTLDEIR